MFIDSFVGVVFDIYVALSNVMSLNVNGIIIFIIFLCGEVCWYLGGESVFMKVIIYVCPNLHRIHVKEGGETGESFSTDFI